MLFTIGAEGARDRVSGVRFCRRGKGGDLFFRIWSNRFYF